MNKYSIDTDQTQPRTMLRTYQVQNLNIEIENQISLEDNLKLKEIYYELKALVVDTRSTAEIEVFLQRAINIAAGYGAAHPLYITLQQTAAVQLKAAKKLLPRSINRIAGIADLKLFLMGDLLGWFDKDT